jgi:hypothetical protein
MGFFAKEIPSCSPFNPMLPLQPRIEYLVLGRLTLWAKQTCLTAQIFLALWQKILFLVKRQVQKE